MELELPPLPSGVRHRAPTLDDAAAIAELQNSVHIATTGVVYATVDEVARSLTDPTMEMARDVRLIEEDGVLVGMAVVHTRAPFERISVDGFIRPTEHGRGLGTFALAWTERRAGEIARFRELAEPPLLEHWVAEGAVSTQAFLEDHRYVVERWFHHMEMDLDDPVPDLPTPEGLTIRAIQPGEEISVAAASDDAFQDHFGFAPSTEEGWRHHMVDRPDFDAGLWFLAVTDDGEIAGDCLSFIHSDRGAPRGLVDDLAVRRPWRRQGLGAALLARGLKEFQARGIASAELFVDAQNPTGALGVYERAGMKVGRSFASYSKPLPAGD